MENKFINPVIANIASLKSEVAATNKMSEKLIQDQNLAIIGLQEKIIMLEHINGGLNRDIGNVARATDKELMSINKLVKKLILLSAASGVFTLIDFAWRLYK